MRTFVKLRELMISHNDLSQKIETLEKRYNAQFRVVFNSIREIINAKSKELLFSSDSNSRAVSMNRLDCSLSSGSGFGFSATWYPLSFRFLVNELFHR